MNPTIKFEWLLEHWGEDAYQNTKALVRTAVSYRTLCSILCTEVIQMLERRRAMRAPGASASSCSAPALSRSVAATPSSKAARAQQSGLERFHSLRKSIRKSSSGSSIGSMEAVAETHAEVDPAEIERQAHLEDEEIVDRQLSKYVDEGILNVDHPEWAYFKLDLV